MIVQNYLTLRNRWFGISDAPFHKTFEVFFWVELGNLTKMRVEGADEAFRKKLGGAKNKRF